jgi:hypothetical protein
MKRITILLAVFCSIICTALADNNNNNNYVKNRTPLAETPFTPLPVGAVRAEGWLLTQLQLQKEGLTGHAEELYSSNNDLGAGCDWLGGTGDSWERAPYYVKGLVALAYVLDDQSLKEKAQKWIDWSLNNQWRSGYFGPSNNNDWWARMPMLYAIRDYYEATGDNRVLPFFTKYFQYQNTNIENQPLSSWGKSRAGDNIEIVFWLYNRTGDAFLLQLADKLKAQAYDWTDIFTNNKFNQFGTDFQPKHNVNIPQAMKMPAIYYQKSQSQADRDAYTHGREHLLCDHGQAHGMQSGHEMVAGKSSLTGLELCSVVEQMQSCETAQMILGDASIGDQLEKVAFNALPGGLTHDMKALSYYQQVNQAISKFGYTGFGQNYDNGLLRSPYSGYGCCRFDFHHGFPYFAKNLWAATSDHGLAAMAYAPSHVTALVADGVEVSIHEATNYPFDEQLTFTVTLSESAAFPLKFRIPAWCSAPEIKVNNTVQTGVESGVFYVINRTWNSGDVVNIHFPMPIIIHEEVNNSVSIQRGALVYSLKINETWSVRNDYGNGFCEYEVLPASAWNYALAIDKSNPSASIQVIKSAMTQNPFSDPPVTLSVAARRLPSWTYSHNERLAADPPYSPAETQEATEHVVLVPYGSGTLRATCLPYIGVSDLITNHFHEDFADGQSGWVQYGGSFYVKEGKYVAANIESSNPCAKSVYSAASFSDFTYEIDIEQNGGGGDAGVMFRSSRFSFGADDYNGYYVGVSSGNNKLVLGKANGSWNQLAAVSMEINENQKYHLKIEAKGTSIKVYLGDMNLPKIAITDASFAAGSVGVRSWNALASWDNISVTTPGHSDVPEKKIDNFYLYPNPTKSNLSVNIPQSGQISVYDAVGKQIYSAAVNSGVAILNAEDYSDGIYLVKLITNQGTDCVKFWKKAG